MNQLKRGFKLFPIMYKYRLEQDKLIEDKESTEFHNWIDMIDKCLIEFNMLHLLYESDDGNVLNEREKRERREKNEFLSRLMLETVDVSLRRIVGRISFISTVRNSRKVLKNKSKYDKNRSSESYLIISKPTRSDLMLFLKCWTLFRDKELFEQCDAKRKLTFDSLFINDNVKANELVVYFNEYHQELFFETIADSTYFDRDYKFISIISNQDADQPSTSSKQRKESLTSPSLPQKLDSNKLRRKLDKLPSLQFDSNKPSTSSQNQFELVRSSKAIQRTSSTVRLPISDSQLGQLPADKIESILEKMQTKPTLSQCLHPQNTSNLFNLIRKFQSFDAVKATNYLINLTYKLRLIEHDNYRYVTSNYNSEEYRRYLKPIIDSQTRYIKDLCNQMAIANHILSCLSVDCHFAILEHLNRKQRITNSNTQSMDASIGSMFVKLEAIKVSINNIITICFYKLPLLLPYYEHITPYLKNLDDQRTLAAYFYVALSPAQKGLVKKINQEFVEPPELEEFLCQFDDEEREKAEKYIDEYFENSKKNDLANGYKSIESTDHLSDMPNLSVNGLYLPFL